MDSCFINNKNRREIKILFPSCNFNINIDSYGLKTLQKFNVIVEKMDVQNLVQIRITDTNDQSKMYICTIDNNLYDRIRIEQSLNVSYQGFIDHLTRILDSCKKEEIHMSLMKDETFHLLQFYEKRPFKNLTHLFLPVNEAPTETILFHINQSLILFQDQIFSCKNQLLQSQQELKYRDDNINQLKNEIRTLNGKLNEQENLIFNRNTEEVNRLQQTIKHINEAKENEEKRLKIIITNLQENINHLTKENCLNNEKFIQETLKTEQQREEIHRLKVSVGNSKEENQKLQNDILAFHNRERKSETLIVDLRKQMIDLQEKYKNCDKQKSDISAQLEAERNICHTKKNALQLATEEISNSNMEIIGLKKELKLLKKKVDIRTEIALRQEKILSEKENENHKLVDTVRTIEKEHGDNMNRSAEFCQTIENLKRHTDVIEEKYGNRLNELAYKLSQMNGNEKVTPLRSCLKRFN